MRLSKKSSKVKNTIEIETELKEKMLWILWSSLGLGRTKFSSIYSFALAIIMGALILKALIEDVQVDYGKSPHMKTTTAVVVRFSDQISCVVAAFAVGFLPRKKLYELSRNLPPASNMDVALTAIFFFIMISIFLTDLIVWLEADPTYYQYTPVYFLHLVVMGLETLYAVTVMKVRRQFAKLNKSASILLLKTGSQMLTLQNILPNVDTATYNVPVKNDESVLENLGDEHWFLCSQVEEVNSIFGVGVLAAMFSVFIHVVITPYFFFLSFMYPTSYGIDKNNFLLVQVLLTGMYAAKLVLLVWPCSSAVQQATNTKRIVAKYMNRGMLSIHQQYQLENVTLQLLHQEVQFTACGLLDLDLPLITSITGAVTTYLVILIQFQNASN